MEKKLSISVFFPCHNEEGNVERVVRRALEVLPKISDDFEIIIVDDGSSDRTADIANRLVKENHTIKAVHHASNRGYGGALQSGFRTAGKQWVFFTDGDGQFDLRELPEFSADAEAADIIAGYRINRQDNLLRKFNGWAWTRLVNLLFGMKVRDIDCAYKLCRREIFDRIEMRSTGALISTEILARAKRAGYRIQEKGVHHFPRTAGQQTGASPRVILRAFKELFKLRRQILGKE